MDRKGWIVIITCILLMGVNFYYMQENQKLVEAQRVAEQAKKKADNSKEAPTSPAAGVAAPVVPAVAKTSTPEQKHTITTGTVSSARVSDAHMSPGVPNVGEGKVSAKNSSSMLPPRK